MIALATPLGLCVGDEPHLGRMGRVPVLGADLVEHLRLVRAGESGLAGASGRPRCPAPGQASEATSESVNEAFSPITSGASAGPLMYGPRQITRCSCLLGYHWRTLCIRTGQRRLSTRSLPVLSESVRWAGIW